MSFGFSVGDCVLLIQLAKTAYKNCVEAGVEYNEIAREIRSLHSVLRPLRDEAQRFDSPLFRQDQYSAAELLNAIDGCKHILDDLQILLAKYEGLAINGETVSVTKKLWHRIRFSTKIEELGAVRGKLIAYTSTISVLLDAAQLRATGRVEEATGRVEDKIDDMSVEMRSGFASLRKAICAIAIKDRADQRGGSTLSLLSLSTYAGDDKDVWREFRRQLIRQGIRSKDLDRHKDSLQAYMLKLHQSGILDEIEEASGQDIVKPWWKKQAFIETANSLPDLQTIDEEEYITPFDQLEANKLPLQPGLGHSVNVTRTAGILTSSQSPLPFQQEIADDTEFAHYGINPRNLETLPGSKEECPVASPDSALFGLPCPTDSEETETETINLKRLQQLTINRSSNFKAPSTSPTVAAVGAPGLISQATRSLLDSKQEHEEGRITDGLASPKSGQPQTLDHDKYLPRINAVSRLPRPMYGEPILSMPTKDQVELLSNGIQSQSTSIYTPSDSGSTLQTIKSGHAVESSSNAGRLSKLLSDTNLPGSDDLAILESHRPDGHTNTNEESPTSWVLHQDSHSVRQMGRGAGPLIDVEDLLRPEDKKLSHITPIRQMPTSSLCRDPSPPISRDLAQNSPLIEKQQTQANAKEDCAQSLVLPALQHPVHPVHPVFTNDPVPPNMMSPGYNQGQTGPQIANSFPFSMMGPTSPFPTPEGWIAHLDPKSGQYYYMPQVTQATQWEVPKGLTPLNVSEVIPRPSPPRRNSPQVQRSSTLGSRLPLPITRTSRSTAVSAPSFDQSPSGSIPLAEDEPRPHRRQRPKTKSGRNATVGNLAVIAPVLASPSMIFGAKMKSEAREYSSEDSNGSAFDDTSDSCSDVNHARRTETVQIPNQVLKQDKKLIPEKDAYEDVMIPVEESVRGELLGRPDASKMPKETSTVQTNHDASNQNMEEQSQHSTPSKHPFSTYVESASESDLEAPGAETHTSRNQSIHIQPNTRYGRPETSRGESISTDSAPVPTSETSTLTIAPREPVRKESLGQKRDSSSLQLDLLAHEGRGRRDTSSSEEKRRPTVRIVSPPREVKKEEKLRGILRPPREKFPEDPWPIREGVAPLKDAKKDGIPPDARWTKITRRMVNPEALERGKERYEAREDFVIVLRVLDKEEIQAYAVATQQIRGEFFNFGMIRVVGVTDRPRSGA